MKIYSLGEKQVSRLSASVCPYKRVKFSENVWTISSTAFEIEALLFAVNRFRKKTKEHSEHK